MTDRVSLHRNLSELRSAKSGGCDIVLHRMIIKFREGHFQTLLASLNAVRSYANTK